MKLVKVSDDGGVAVDDKFVLSSLFNIEAHTAWCRDSCFVTSCACGTLIQEVVFFAGRGPHRIADVMRLQPNIALVIERVRASVSPIKELSMRARFVSIRYRSRAIVSTFVSCRRYRVTDRIYNARTGPLHVCGMSDDVMLTS